MLSRILISVLVLSFGLGAWGYIVWHQSISSNERIYEVKRGDSWARLARQWEQNESLPSALLLRMQVRLFGHAGSLRPGEFTVPADSTTFDLLQVLTSGRPNAYRVTLVEGKKLSDALRTLAAESKLKQDIKPLTPASVAEFFAMDGSPEGLFYPDTYVYYPGDCVSDLLKQARARLDDVLEEEWQRHLDREAQGSAPKGAIKLPYKASYDVLVMASIVEKETGVSSERSEIAGVFVRRMNKNMRLETDPTVIYGLGESFGGDLKRKHLGDSSNPYNTYRHKGLPPGPIALAGREAIHAALNPDSGQALYFVAKGDGSHYFSKTYDEHRAAVRRYQLQRNRETYRSSPLVQQ